MAKSKKTKAAKKVRKLRQKYLRKRCYADGVKSLLKVRQANALTSTDPCEAERLAYLQSLLEELEAELVLLEKKITRMEKEEALADCEMMQQVAV